MFDDSLLDDPAALAAADDRLRWLAEAGARVRIETGRSDVTALDDLGERYRPRAVIASGPESRLVRAVLEPTCPVPFLAWPNHDLPAWVGALDLVIVLTGADEDPDASAAIAEAARRGARVLVGCPAGSLVARQAVGRQITCHTTTTDDPLATAIVLLSALHRTSLGPPVDPEAVAGAMDRVAQECSPLLSVGANPAKDLAVSIADDATLVWGGSVLAARASRRIAEALRLADHGRALAVDADELVPLLEQAVRRDPFADPFESPDTGCTTMVVLDDADPAAERTRRRVVAEAQAHDVRVCVISEADGSLVERYVGLLQRGLFAASYLQVGLSAS